jgi:hypothetical protein
LSPISASVFAPSCMLADALTKLVLVQGARAKGLVNRLGGRAFIVNAAATPNTMVAQAARQCGFQPVIANGLLGGSLLRPGCWLLFHYFLRGMASSERHLIRSKSGGCGFRRTNVARAGLFAAHPYSAWMASTQEHTGRQCRQRVALPGRLWICALLLRRRGAALDKSLPLGLGLGMPLLLVWHVWKGRRIKAVEHHRPQIAAVESTGLKLWGSDPTPR